MLLESGLGEATMWGKMWLGSDSTPGPKVDVQGPGELLLEEELRYGREVGFPGGVRGERHNAELMAKCSSLAEEVPEESRVFGKRQKGSQPLGPM